jgi:protocatechuate 3,4-dioxygenase beta subunit
MTSEGHSQWKKLRLGLMVLAGILVIGLGLGYVFISQGVASLPEAPSQEFSPEVEPRLGQPDSVPREAIAQRDVAVGRTSAKAPIAEPAPLRGAATRSIVAGRVMDDLSQPVTRFKLRVRPVVVESSSHGRFEPKPFSRKFENPHGSFELDDLSKGEWELIVSDSGQVESAPLVISLPGEEREVTLILPRPGTVSGKVVNFHGDPIAEAQIYLWSAGEEDPSFFLSAQADPRARAGSDGRFRIEGVQPAEHRIMAKHYAYADSEGVPVMVKSGQASEDVLITLDQGGRIQGVVDPSQGVVAGREIGLYSFRGSVGWRSTETDALGRFAIERVMPQDYVIELKSAPVAIESSVSTTETDSSIRKNISVKSGDTTEVVFGGPTRSILVQGIVTSLGKPLPKITVQASSRDGNEDLGEKSTTDSDGRYRLHVQGPGEYQLFVSANYGSYATFDRTVPDLPEVEIVLDVPTGVISGRVSGAEGQALHRVPVTAVRTGSTDAASFYKSFRRMYTEEDGTFEFRLLPSGDYVIRTPDGFQDDRPPPRVPFGRVVISELRVRDDASPNALEIRLPPEARISGLILDTKGSAVAGAWIRAKDARGLSLSARWELQTDATGHFLLENVAAGTYTVLVRGDPVQESEPVVVEVGKTSMTKFQLR